MSPAGKWDGSSTALIPVKENTANLRAIKELEAIKLKKKQQEDQRLALEVSQQNYQTISDRRLKQ